MARLWCPTKMKNKLCWVEQSCTKSFQLYDMDFYCNIPSLLTCSYCQTLGNNGGGHLEAYCTILKRTVRKQSDTNRKEVKDVTEKTPRTNEKCTHQETNDESENNIVYCGFTSSPRFARPTDKIRQYTRSLLAMLVTGFLPVSLSLILLLSSSSLAFCSSIYVYIHIYETEKNYVIIFFYVYLNNIVYCGFTSSPRFARPTDKIRQYTRSLLAMLVTGFLPVSLSLILLLSSSSLAFCSSIYVYIHIYETEKNYVIIFFYVYLF